MVGVAVENKDRSKKKDYPLGVKKKAKPSGLEIHFDDGSVKSIDLPEKYKSHPLEASLIMFLHERIEKLELEEERNRKRFHQLRNSVKYK